MFSKRSISIFLVLLTFFSAIGLNHYVLASTSGPSKYEYDENITFSKQSIEAIRHTLPTYPQDYQNNEALWKSTNGYWLNVELWKDKEKIIYGEPTDINSGVNDFKKTANGYYIKDGDRGEYRYHGFDIMGNKYTNIDFPPDITSSLTLEEKQWHYQPWRNPINLPAPPDEISPYNEDAILFGNTKTQRWINEAFRGPEDWDILNGINRDGTDASSMNKYDYIHVLSPPTMESTGEGRMWNQSAYSGKNYYQTFSVSTINEKQQNPIDCTVEILNKDGLKLTANEAYIKVDVKVTGKILDENCYDEGVSDTDKPLYYNREDIENWSIKLTSNSNYEREITLGSGLVDDIPVGEKQKNVSYTFKGIEISRAQLESNDLILFVGRVQAKFVEGISDPKESYDQKYVTIEEGQGFKSYFTIFNAIMLEHGNDLIPYQLGYGDLSLGDILSYDIEVTNNDNGDSTTFNYFAIDDFIVCQDIYNFIDIYTGGEDGTEQSEFNFTISQTITTVDGQMDTYSKDQTIMIGSLEPVLVEPDVNIPTEAFDIVPFNPIDNTDMSTVAQKHAYINGKEVSYDSLFSGSYTFGASDKNLLYFIEVEYESLDGFPASVARWVNVKTTKPQIQYSMDGTFKENRKLTIDNTSDTINDAELINNYPITYTWSYEAVEGDDSNRRINDISDLYKELLYKEKGIYKITLEGTNTLGRTADPYTFEFTILEDYEPDITMHIWNNVLTREEKISINHGVGSIDEDNITLNTLEIYYDTDNDGECETLLQTMNSEDFVDYKPMSLGNYKIVNYVEEEFGQETISEFIDEADKKTATAERYFFVENVRPMTQIYTDVPLDFPQVDVFIMTDENLDRTKNDTLRGARIDYKNYLMGQSIVADVQAWDMHTYTYSTSASTSRNTGSSYPSSSISYSSGGYSGILSRTSVSNNRYKTDEGYYKTVTYSDSKTATGTRRQSGSVYLPSKYDSDRTPSSISYSSGGYTGRLSKTGMSGYRSTAITDSDGVYIGYRYSYTMNYSGTVTKSWSEQVWVSNWVWHNNYTGYYSGTIDKDVRQPYENPYRNLSDKYLVYVSDGDISQLSDLEMVLGDADVTLILIGDSTIKSQIEHDYFFENNKPVDEIMVDVLGVIENENPYESSYKIIQGQSFNIDTANYDEESDTIVEEYFQYVHDPNIFDNNQGIESYASSSYSDTSNWTTFKATQFTKKGYYEIYRRIKDNPTSDPNFADFSMYSNTPKIGLIVHEEPIADCTLDWDYDPITLTYKTTWVDDSYDPDHQYNRSDKGIAERKIMYRESGGEWIYKIPDDLSPGTYELQYSVKDIEGAWSSPYVMSFTLSPTPTIQLNASARPLDNNFTLASIPASEYLEVYNIWTRYPYPHRLEVALYDGVTRVSSIKTIDYYTGTKVNNDIDWDNISYKIPENLVDGSYILKLRAVDTSNGSIQKEVNYNLTVSTPIDLTLTNVPLEFTGDSTINLEVETSKYVDEVKVTLFKDTIYEATYDMTLKFTGERKVWEYSYYIPLGAIPEENYLSEFVATTSNDNNQTKSQGYLVKNLDLSDFRIAKLVNHKRYEGEYPILYDSMYVPVEYKTGYMITFKINAIGSPDNIKMKISHVGYEEEFNMIKESENGSDSIWTLEWYADPFAPYMITINTDITAYKGATILNFNNKYGWNGNFLRIIGSIEEDVQIDLEL